MSPDFSLFPFYFTADAAAITRLLLLIGLQPHLSRGNFMHFRVGDANLAIHDAEGSTTEATGETTHLCLHINQATEAHQYLNEQGMNTVLWDESYAQQAKVMSPDGREVWINEEQHDTYGYVVHPAAQPHHRIEVCLYWPTQNLEADRAFFENLGWQAGTDKRTLSRKGTQGVIFLKPRGDEALGMQAEVGLELLTDEPLNLLRVRLEQAGFSVQPKESGHGWLVSVAPGEVIAIDTWNE